MLFRSQICISLYGMSVGVFALLLFLHGFFPIKRSDGSIASRSDLPTSIENVSLNVSSLYKPIIKRLIIMVIDALRVDFVASSEGKLNMPYTASLINEKEACLMTAKTTPPTVTMPRIKALTTGTVPNFVDVALNIGSSEIFEDSLILQAEINGLNIVFYGDDTWLKLFPKSFMRKDGTTSFFVSDFTEVDDNVTRHLAKELDADDWKIMILHYLGLDHIGHLEGPKSSHVRPKLQEMDSIIQMIHHKFIEWKEVSPEPSVLVVCGDHGMKDSGGHGGASLAEILVPLVVIGQSCPPISWDDGPDKLVSQIDLVPVLSVLLGLPIPRSNLGKIVPALLGQLPVENLLYALYYNAKQVAAQYEKNGDPDLEGSYLEYKEAVKLHVAWLQSNSSADLDLAGRIGALYIAGLKGMSSKLADSLITYDLYALAVAICILWQTCHVLLLTASREPSSGLVNGETFLLALLYLIVNVLYCSWSMSHSTLCRLTPSSVFVLLPVLVITARNTHIVKYSYSVGANIKEFRSLSRQSCILMLGCALHVLSLAASSLIEEEHQVFYFLWLTFAVVSSYNFIRMSYLGHNTKQTLIYQSMGNLILLRVFRKWNQTGDKWASLPDIGDWLVQPENRIYLSIVLFIGLVGVTWSCCHINSAQKKSSQLLDAGLCFSAAVCVYCYRTAIGNVVLPCAYPQSRGNGEVRVFWCILILLLGKQVLSALHQQHTSWRNCSQTMYQMLSRIVSCWLLLCALLHRPHNVLLSAAQVWMSRCVCAVIKLQGRATDVVCLVIIHIWLGMVFFFFQGNSNSLANIDVAAGYVGHEDYNPITVGIFLIINTYSGPVLSHLLLVSKLSQHAMDYSFQEFCDQLSAAYRVIACARLFPVSVYTLLVMLQRYHLFVWTVFSPKLLYESVHTAVVFMLLLSTHLVISACLTRHQPFVKHKK